jgi:hypothetical protein
MDMLTDLLSTVAEGGKVILEEENYLLARVSIDGKAMLAEISRGFPGGLSPSDWPDVDGVLLHDSQIHPGGDSGTSILLYSIPDYAELFIETIMRDGRFSETDALETGKKVLSIIRRVHDEGYRRGYLGPENVLRTDAGKHYILGGARGVPDTPFSPPEAIGRTVDDPRSDVYALGLLMFRNIAGSDNRDIQVEAWNDLSNKMLELFENMVSPDADNRFPNLLVLSEELDSFNPDYGTPNFKVANKCRRSQVKNKKLSIYVYIVFAVAVIALLLLIINPNDDRQQDQQNVITDSDAQIREIDSTEVGSQSSPEEAVALHVDNYAEPVVWISNGTGQPGRASEFRQEQATAYSSVYTCSGSLRGNSILLARREDPDLSLENQDRIYPIAELLSSRDSTMQVLPVDITLLLGRDLIDDRISPGIVLPVSSPAGTLYVDIANHGLEASYGGTGAATWVRSVLNNRSIILNGEEWLITVVDFRDGDMQNSELGIPASLESTLFLYRRDLLLLNEAEEEIREALLENTAGEPSTSTMLVPPDIWILLGQ